MFFKWTFFFFWSFKIWHNYYCCLLWLWSRDLENNFSSSPTLLPPLYLCAFYIFYIFHKFILFASQTTLTTSYFLFPRVKIKENWKRFKDFSDWLGSFLHSKLVLSWYGVNAEPKCEISNRCKCGQVHFWDLKWANTVLRLRPHFCRAGVCARGFLPSRIRPPPHPGLFRLANDDHHQTCL